MQAVSNLCKEQVNQRNNQLTYKQRLFKNFEPYTLPTTYKTQDDENLFYKNLPKQNLEIWGELSNPQKN